MKHIITLLAVLLLALPAAAQDRSFAFVDLDKVVAHMPETQALETERNNRVRAAESSITQMRGELERARNDYQTAMLTGSANSLKILEDTISKLRSDLTTQEYLAEQELKTWVEAERGKLYAAARLEVQRLRAERNFIAILKTDSAVAVDPTADLTAVVIERLGGSLE